MNRERGINLFQMLIYFLVTTVIVTGIYLLAKATTTSQKNTTISVQDVEHVFKTCPIPFSKWELPEQVSSVCDDPILEKQDFTVTPTSLYVVAKNGRKLRLIEIKPSLPTALSYLPESEAKTICSAFKELAKEIRKRGGFAVAKCGRKLPVLRIGVPIENLPFNKDKKSVSSGSENSGIALFSLFSLISVF